MKHIHFKKPELALFQRQMGIIRSNHIVKLWLKCWVLMAKTMVMVNLISSTNVLPGSAAPGQDHVKGI
jgi:hypothetical protein